MKTERITTLTIGIFALVFALGTVVTLLAISNEQYNRQQVVTQIATAQAKALERELFYALSSTYALAAAMDESGSIRDFEALAARMLQHYQGIGSLQLAPNAVVSQIYPLEGNEAALGHDLLNDPDRRADVLLAIQTRELTLAGPFELVQGGTAVIGRYPVFLDNDEFWGLTIALIHLDELLAGSDLLAVAANGYDYQLARIDPASDERILFAASTTEALSNPVVLPIQVANNQWELALAPATGWRNGYLIGLGTFAALGAAAIIALLAHRLLHHMARLDTTNQALQTSRQHQQALLEVIPDTILRVDARGNCLEQIVTSGDSQSGQNLIGQTLAAIFGGSAAGDFYGGVQLALETGRVQTIEYATPADDTEHHHYEARIVGMREADEALVIIRDVTQRKRVEAALRHSEQRHRTVADLNTDWTYWQKADGSLEYVSPACEQICGYTPDELRSSPALIWQIILVEDLPIWENHLHPLVKTSETRQIQLRIQHRDGSIRWIEHTCRPVFNDAGIFDGYHVNNRDMTQRQQAEDALRQSRSHYQLLADNMVDVVWLLDLSTMKFTYVSPSVERLRGYTPEEVIAQPLEYAMTPESFRLIEEILPARLTAFEAGDPTVIVQTDDIEQTRKDGSTVWTEVVTTLLRDEETGAISALGVSRDITERRRAQQQELQTRMEQARVQLLTTFIQNATHEFRTPLAVINTNTYLMTRIDNVEQRQQKADQITAQVQYISNLVDRLMAVATLESAPSLMGAKVDLNGIVDAVCRRTSYLEPPTPRVSTRLQENLPGVLGNPHYLADALSQLIENAIRYTPEDGQITVVTGTDPEAGTVWIEVHDTGPGIPPDVLPYIFDTFWREDESHSTPGLGLGLSIAQRVVELHDGHLSASSDTGSGAVFRMALPAALDAGYQQSVPVHVNNRGALDNNVLK